MAAPCAPALWWRAPAARRTGRSELHTGWQAAPTPGPGAAKRHRRAAFPSPAAGGSAGWSRRYFQTRGFPPAGAVHRRHWPRRWPACAAAPSGKWRPAPAPARPRNRGRQAAQSGWQAWVRLFLNQMTSEVRQLACLGETMGARWDCGGRAGITLGAGVGRQALLAVIGRVFCMRRCCPRFSATNIA